MLLLILVVLIVLAFGGGYYHGPGIGYYGGGGIGLILLILLVVLLLNGRLSAIAMRNIKVCFELIEDGIPLDESKQVVITVDETTVDALKKIPELQAVWDSRPDAWKSGPIPENQKPACMATLKVFSEMRDIEKPLRDMCDAAGVVIARHMFSTLKALLQKA